MIITPEATPFILQARSQTREANRMELSRGLVEPGTLIIDAKGHLLLHGIGSLNQNRCQIDMKKYIGQRFLCLE